ncbi:glutamate racemase [Blochmannia endosymbiont of Polyrhachis (Hedomyrma) turneri]|uniref:glutamate racemase n=1 Tax=Blochmannia endosymbiont of Polyrhachis (Hedomyrma) turneri TaxID=1505596 RepID=UPI00061A724D|nr:glutamate racemase [Blochmannia endosymbiont of Polyrhachis (Hedomyrma) turneri]AKC60148.1 glutamate racemase [Blochmannia endosymbiont of Polyrhachis (Hedomyrma) turneri]
MVVVVNDINCCVRLNNHQLTVLIFDSGVGGLSIYQELRVLLPYIRYLYFFDNEVFPYGESSHLSILDRVNSIFRAVCRYHKLDLVIIACNTATVTFLETVRSCFFFPIIGIIPDIRLGIRCTRNGVVGLLATYRTINSKLILNIINRLSTHCNILLLSASELVRCVEDKVLNNKQVSINLLYEIFSPWLSLSKKPDTIILGCTHFLHLEYEFRLIFQKRVCLVGSSKNLAYRIACLLKNSNMYVGNIGVKTIENQAYCSVITDTVFMQWSLVLYRYGFSSLAEISV